MELGNNKEVVNSLGGGEGSSQNGSNNKQTTVGDVALGAIIRKPNTSKEVT